MRVVGIVSLETAGLRGSPGACKPLIYYPPKCRDGLGLFIEEVFKETGLVKRWWIRIPLTIVAKLSNPINGLSWIDQ